MLLPTVGAVCVCVYILERNYIKIYNFLERLILKDPGQGLNSMDQSGSII